MSEAHLCPATASSHHFHTDGARGFYVGSSYLALCCHCGRVQLIVYQGRQDTPDLTLFRKGECGSFVRAS